jgi:hypothetical protein
MRASVFTIVLSCSAFFAVGQAGAVSVTLPSDSNVAYSAYSSKTIEQPWAAQRPEVQLTEQHLADLIATKLGVARGSAELFRYRLENAPSNATVLRGQIDGGGIKLKLTW